MKLVLVKQQGRTPKLGLSGWRGSSQCSQCPSPGCPAGNSGAPRGVRASSGAVPGARRCRGVPWPLPATGSLFRALFAAISRRFCLPPSDRMCGVQGIHKTGSMGQTDSLKQNFRLFPACLGLSVGCPHPSGLPLETDQSQPLKGKNNPDKTNPDKINPDQITPSKAISGRAGSPHSAGELFQQRRERRPGGNRGSAALRASGN